MKVHFFSITINTKAERESRDTPNIIHILHQKLHKVRKVFM